MLELNPMKLIYSIDELKTMNYSTYKIDRLVQEKKLKKLNRKHYENLNYLGDTHDFYYANAYVSHGIICLMSAASFYELTTVRPLEIDIALYRKNKVYTYPDTLHLHPYYFSKERYTTGIIKVEHGYDSFFIYDLEKTVVDIVYYREKIGVQETKEILYNYLNRKDRNLNTLLQYAKQLGCENIIRKYMEVLL